MNPSRRNAIIETAENAHSAHPDWTRWRCLREAVRIVKRLEAIIDASMSTKH